MQSNSVVLTENGAVSLASTTDPRLNLFFKTVRDVGTFEHDTKKCEGDSPSGAVLLNEKLYEMIDSSFALYPLDTMKILMNWRDCRGGKGDHKGFLVSMAYIAKMYPEWFKANLKLLHIYGSYLDYVKLWHLVESVALKRVIMHLIVDTLFDDMVKLEDIETSQGNKGETQVSLLAKWIPSEKYKWDRYNNSRFVFELCREYFGVKRVDNSHLKTLRKNVLTPLRKHLDLVERKMCAKEFHQINYSSVPSVAMNKYRKAFAKRDETRFNEYIENVKSGKDKINSSQVYPHNLVAKYLSSSAVVDEVIEAQWREIKQKATASGAFDRSIVVCDVSTSMDGTPMEVAIALGLLGLYENKLITFSATPELHYVPDGTLYDQVRNVSCMSWGMNTNFDRVMDLVLGLSARKPDESIKRIFVFSDMQFDVAFSKTNTVTKFQLMQQKFKRANVEMPQIVFWNLRGDTNDFPVQSDERGVILMSGYSPSLLNSLLDGKDITPLDVLLNVIDSSRYDVVVSP
jgi:hypothetical protein